MSKYPPPTTAASMLNPLSQKAKRQELEDELAFQMKALGLPAPERQFKFHPTRKWAFDFCWTGLMLALEVDGATWSGGRHVRGEGVENDCEKVCAAVALGYRVLRVTGNQVRSGAAVGWIEECLRSLGESANLPLDK
jgi:very-short-patch-repair endonuclease